MNRSSKPLQWDIFCRVIDNFGDIGVCWRLAADLANRGHLVRLWVDDASALTWMAPGGCTGVTVLGWANTLYSADLARLIDSPCEVMIESFGCEIPPSFVAGCVLSHGAGGSKPLWINLEYLSAEAYVERSHGLPSPVQTGPAAGWTKSFYYPGFQESTGGLLREPDVAIRQATFDRCTWLAEKGLPLPEKTGEKLVLLFCYEPQALGALMQQLNANGLDGGPVRLLVAAGRAEKAIADLMKRSQSKNIDQKYLKPNEYFGNMLSISYLPLLSQADFDHALWAADLNFVRGEDSVVRALWAAKPFVWQIYPQDDGAQRAKLDAFLDMMGAPESLRRFYRLWNATSTGAAASSTVDNLGAAASPLNNTALQQWAKNAHATRSRLLAQQDLTSQLIRFVEKKR